MGGNTFDQTNKLTLEQYNILINKLIPLQIKFILPYRLDNKSNYSDIDLIVSETELITNEISSIIPIVDSKIIQLDRELNMYSKHLLTSENIQIDLLKSYDNSSMEITRVFFSYGCANIFLKHLVSIVDKSFKLSCLGLTLNNNKIKIPEGVRFFQLGITNRLIIDPLYIFQLIDLDYIRFIQGFRDEFDLLDFFKTSKYYPLLSFKKASKFNHDYKRVESFRNLVDNCLLNIS